MQVASHKACRHHRPSGARASLCSPWGGIDMGARRKMWRCWCQCTCLQSHIVQALEVGSHRKRATSSSSVDDLRACLIEPQVEMISEKFCECNSYWKACAASQEAESSNFAGQERGVLILHRPPASHCPTQSLGLQPPHQSFPLPSNM